MVGPVPILTTTRRGYCLAAVFFKYFLCFLNIGKLPCQQFC
nr:MAG TPA: hypothetical protein [Caudoviricetes sp.]